MNGKHPTLAEAVRILFKRGIPAGTAEVGKFVCCSVAEAGAEPFSLLASIVMSINRADAVVVVAATGEMEGCEKVVDDGAGVEEFCLSGFLVTVEGTTVVLASLCPS
jgi:hypothetical protein